MKLRRMLFLVVDGSRAVGRLVVTVEGLRRQSTAAALDTATESGKASAVIRRSKIR